MSDHTSADSGQKKAIEDATDAIPVDIIDGLKDCPTYGAVDMGVELILRAAAPILIQHGRELAAKAMYDEVMSKSGNVEVAEDVKRVCLDGASTFNPSCDLPRGED